MTTQTTIETPTYPSPAPEPGPPDFEDGKRTAGTRSHNDLRDNLARWLVIPPEDADLIDFCLAVMKSHGLTGDPLWGMVIDASGGGKTELLRAFRKRADAYFLSKLSEKTLISGYRDRKHPDKDPSLLPELHEKVLIIKDLAPLLSMRRESRNAIISQLRDAYDGFTDQGHGNIGRVQYEARFSLLAASTQAIERADAIDQELGERFIKFRARSNDSKSKVRKALANVGFDDTMRGDIEAAITNYLDSLPPLRITAIAPALQDCLIALADFTARARSAVARDRKGDRQYDPRPEVGTRLVKELGKLLLALAAVRGKSEPDEEDLATVRRVADDCLPPNRLAVIQVLRRGPAKQAVVERATQLPPATVWRTLDNLAVLGLARKDAEDLWQVAS